MVLSCIENLPAPFRQMTATLIEVCAYAGTGNVLKVRIDLNSFVRVSS